MSLDNVYNAKILEFAGNIPHAERLTEPHGTAKAHSKLCGSTVIIDVAQKDGRISAYGQDVKACALGQASASILARNALGSSLDELVDVRDAMATA